VTDRLARLREIVRELGADGAIITHATNRRYFSGFPAAEDAPDESYGVLFVNPDEAILFSSPTNLPWAAASARPPVVARPWQQPWQEFLSQEFAARAMRRVAFEDRALSVADYAAITGKAPNLELVPFENALSEVRGVKDESELAAIAAAARITDAALASVVRDLRPGVTERQLAWRLELAIRELGADGLAFSVGVAAGPHSARPHHDATDRAIAAGEPLVIDMGAEVDGYCADLTRTICPGDPPATFRDRYNMVLAAQELALQGIRPGMTGREADALARDALTRSGYGEQFVHGLGHGVGLLIHEFPGLGTRSDDELRPGHVITVEPGIYLEEWGGIRIEDLCVVTATGLDILSAAPK
jgi:Xaa-Pro aminopeptidase